MNTLRKLAEINNDANFELIATHVLRLAKSEYASVIHTGINQDGKPVASPVDGFGQVPHSKPPHYVQFQHTTTSCEGLQKKWLHDHTSVQVRKKGKSRKSKLPSESDDGDVLKAGRQISKIQQNYPDAQFTIVLTTNCTIHEIDFLNQIYDKVKSFGQNVSVDIWTADRLVGFLDTTREGHWIRKEYLGIEAEMLSHFLLTDICFSSLHHYKQYCRFLTPPDKWVHRDFSLENSPEQPKTLHFLVGESGFGKSAYAYERFEQYLKDGNFALWVPAHFIENHINIYRVIDDVFQELYPSLTSGEADQLPYLLQQNGNPLLLVIDDVNRVKQPQNIINQLINWFNFDSALTQQQKSKLPPDPFIAICPIWPQIMRSVQATSNWVATTSISTFAVEQATCAIQDAKAISQLTARDLAIQLNGDPFLIGVLCSEQSDFDLSNITPTIASRRIIQKFVEQHFFQSDYGEFVLEDYNNTLRAVVDFMLMTRNLQPKWSQLRDHLGINSLQWRVLDRIARYEVICSKEARLDHFRFRHDRIFESIAVECFIRKLSETPQEEIIWEPHYAEMVGAALAQITHCEDELLEHFAEKLPLVLASAFRTFGEPTSPMHRRIIDILKRWTSWPLRFGGQASPHAWEFVSILSRVDSPIVNDILLQNHPYASYPYDLIIALARFRNGCVKSGLKFCSVYGLQMAVNDDWHIVLPHVKQRHGETIFNELESILLSTEVSDADDKAALILAGYVGDERLCEAIAAGWHNCNPDLKTMHYALWAALRCFRETKAQVFHPIIRYWAEQPNVEIEKKESYRESVVGPMGGISNPIINNNYPLSIGALSYLKEQAENYPEIRPVVAHLLGYFDYPATLEYAIEYYASLLDTDPNSHEASSFQSFWNPRGFSKRGLSFETITHLKSIWESTIKSNNIRKLAFGLWAQCVNPIPILELQSIDPDSPLFENALWLRAYHHDISAVSPLVKKLAENDNWFRIADRLWCEEIRKVAIAAFESLQDETPTDFSGGKTNKHYHLNELLQRLPIEEAEELLVKHWHFLQYSRLFIQEALFIGTPKCVKLVEDTFVNVSTEINVFEHLSVHNKILGHKFNLSLLKHLTPYAAHFDEHTFRTFANACTEAGGEGIQWLKENLSELLEERGERAYYLPTLDDLIDRLNHGEGRTDSYWLEHWFNKLGQYDPNLDPFEVLENWFKSKPTWQRFQTVATAIEIKGTRKHLEILNHPLEHGTLWMEDEIKKNLAYKLARRTLT